MPQDRFNLNVRAALLAAIASAYPVIGYSAPAAQVDFAVGNVTAVGANGQSRPLGKGAQIEQGDTVNTNGGRAQLRFTDGAYVSLQPESQFRIDQYRFDGKQDGNEKGFFSLLKGGLRTITGLVGRTSKQNYQVTTSVATIGIRGTEYTIQYGNSVTGTVGEGEINVCNGAGCLSVTNGESYYVQTQEIRPILTNKRTDLPPPEPTQPPSNFVSAENRNPDGSLTALIITKPPVEVIITGTQSPVSIGRVSDSCGIATYCSSNFGSVTFDGNGVLTDLNGETLSNIAMSGNDGIIAWGTGISSSGAETVHFIVGLPTPASDLANLAISSPVGTYVLIGGTSPTFRDFSSGTTVSGTLTGASFSANFATMKVDASVAMRFNTAAGAMALSAAGTGMSISTFSGSAFSGSFCASNNCTLAGGTCSTSWLNMQGFLAGPNAVRAGLVYDVSVFGSTGSTSINGNAIGAAAFAKR
jgi:hypothetical protein